MITTLRHSLLAAGLIVVASAAQASTVDGSVVGTITFALGDAVVVHADGSSTPLKKGSALRQTDAVHTGGNGQVHVRMVDQALVSVRPNSRLVIQDYRFDAQAPERSVIRFTLEQGTMRSITGAGGHAAKDHYRLNTPLAAIGIRGTDFTVAASEQSTIAGVHSGAIAMTPYGADCRADALGACGGPAASVLTAAMRDLQLQIDRGEAQPALVPATRMLDALPDEPTASKRKSGEDGGVVANASAATASTKTEAVNEVTAVKVVTTTPLPPPPLPETPPTPEVPTPPALPPTPPVTVIPPSSTPPEKLAVNWGRWSTAPIAGKTIGEARAALGNGAETTFANDLFAMMRVGGPMNLPTSETYAFALGQSEAYLLSGKTATAATITDPRLTIDFGQRQFATSLNVSVSGMADTAITASGAVNSNGLFTSTSASPSTSVQGALNRDGTQAGYLFTRTLDGGQVLSGATSWYR